MEIEEKEYLLEMKLTKVDEETYALSYLNKIFYIKEILYDTFQHLKDGKSKNEILNILNSKFDCEIELNELEKLIEDTIAKVALTSKAETTLSLYIYAKISILKERHLIKITPFFKFLFNKWLVILLTLISLGASFYFMGYILTYGLLNTQLSMAQGLKYILLNYLFIAIIGIFHEIGHSTASAKYGINSKEVGFGFYLVFPVFYTDISRIWLLNKRKRVIINAAGIYFQLIISIIIVSIFFLGKYSINYQILLKTIFLSNFSLCFFAMNPFLRNDGYWMYSDFFNLPNLTAKAMAYPVHFYKTILSQSSPLSFKEKLVKIKQGFPLLIYSLGYNIIMPLLYLGIILFTYKNIANLIYLLNKPSFIANPTSGENIYELITSIFAILLNAYFLYSIIRLIYKKYIMKYDKQSK